MWWALLGCIPSDDPPTLRILQPDSDLVSGSVMFQADARDDYGLKSVVWAIDGDVVVEGAEGTWPSTGDGTVELTVLAEDSVGQVTARTRTLRVDNTDPVVEITSPSANQAVNGDLDVTWTVSDSSAIVSEELKVNGQTSSLPVDTTAFDSGTMEITVLATDEAGNVGGETVRVNVDQPPTVEIRLSDGARVSEEVLVPVTAKDDVGVNSLRFYVDGDLRKSVYDSPWSWRWDTCGDPLGQTALSVELRDTRNQTAEHAITVEVHRDTQIELEVDAVLPQGGEHPFTAWVSDETGETPRLAVDGIDVGWMVAAATGPGDCPSACTDTCAFYEGGFEVGDLAAGTHTVTLHIGDTSASVVVTKPADADGDGYGDVADGGDDCDDSEPAVNPGAEEICADGIDNDCDGTSGACGWGTTWLDSDSTVTISGQDYFELGAKLEMATDTDGDGTAELMVQGNSAVYLFEGPLSGDLTVDDAQAALLGSAYFGFDMADVGDVDGDGTTDVLVGRRDYRYAYLFLGPLTGEINQADADLFLTDNDDQDIGSRALGLDHNDDGERDLLIGGDTNRGRLYIFNGPLTSDRDIDDALQIYGDSWNSTANRPATGDFNGDGVDDLVIGAYLPAEVAIFYGPITSDARHVNGDVLIQDPDSSAFGYSVAIGDADGDGADDLAVGAPDDNSNLGAVYLFQGPLGGTAAFSDHVAQVDGVSTTVELGWDVVFTPDGDGDGAQELAASSIHDDTVANSGGAAYVLYSSLSGTLDCDRDGAILGTQDGDWLGYALTAGDPGIGHPTLFVGAPQDDDGGNTAGQVTVWPEYGM